MLAVALVPTAGCTNVNSGDEAEVVVAASLELSGSAADLGTAYKRALDLRVAQINSGGLLGRRRIALRVRDNRSDPAIALTQITEFAGDSDVTAIITGACAECVTGAAKVINERHLPTIALSPVAEVSAPLADRKYIFRLAPNVDDDAGVLAGELVRAGQRKVAFVSSDDAYGRGGAEALAREVAKIGAKLVAHGQYAPTDSDLSRAARTALAGGPDAIVVWGYPSGRDGHRGHPRRRLQGPGVPGRRRRRGALPRRTVRDHRRQRRSSSPRRSPSTTSSRPPPRRRPAGNGSRTTCPATGRTTGTRRSPRTPCSSS